MWARMGERLRTECFEGREFKEKNDFCYATDVDMAIFFHKVYA